MPAATIVCAALPLGYGPAAKLLLVARGLRARGFRLRFAGAGSARELAARAAVFDDLVDDARAAIRSADAVLSAMDREHVALAQELGRPTYVLDSLAWMRDRIPECFLRARRYWVQDFAGVRERVAAEATDALVVGPLVAEATAERARTRLVVNLGGCEAPPGSPGEDPTYADFVVRGLVAAGVAPRGTVVMAGARCIARLRERFAGAPLELVSAAHDEALALLRGAAAVLTSPGLTATLECFQLGVPAFFLPPQNYSQWWILKKLRERDAAPTSFHWEDAAPEPRIVERMAEEARAPLVRAAIHRGAADPRPFEEALRGIAAADGPAIAARQAAFFRSLGDNGVDTIVRDLAEQLCAS